MGMIDPPSALEYASGDSSWAGGRETARPLHVEPGHVTSSLRMSDDVAKAALLVTVPIAAAVIGSTVAAWRPPGEKTIVGIQHFAAGVVFAAVAGEVLPDIRDQALVPVLVGFSLGVVMLLVLRRFAERAEAAAAEGPALPFGLLATIAIDLMIDGLLVGIGVSLGQSQGRVLTIALTLEVLFLALSMTASLSERGFSRVRAAAIPSLLSLSMAVGAIGGAALLSGASDSLQAGVLAFGAAALLYLVTEELLVEAHQGPETPFLTSLFFIGFILLFTLEGAI